jgi:cytochrome c553
LLSLLPRSLWATLSLLLLASPCLAARARPPVPTAAGENVYQRGVLSTGEPLRGERASISGVEGAAAACANCHRRSGLGEVEGRFSVPPVTAHYLYRPRSRFNPGHTDGGELPAAEPEPGARPELLQQARSAYTDATLARAIREGVGPDGTPLGYLMPRFQIDGSDMASLIAYMKQLSRQPSPGVGETALEFATVITPDADPLKRRGMLDVLRHFFGEENVFSGDQGPPPQYSHQFIPITHRWQLHVWELTGAAESWEAQLDQHLKRNPVFAVISGIGGKTWEPVHRFCERSGVPCLFPNVDVPVVAEQDFYDVYWSKGVLLEAQLIGARVRSAADTGKGVAAGSRRLVQVYRRGDIGENAAAQLRVALASASPVAEISDRVLDPGAAPGQLRAALSDARADDILVLWLRPDDIRSLPPQPPPAAAVFVSGLLGGLEQAPLAGDWREIARMTYPFALPDQRRIFMDYPLGWMRFKHIPVVDELTQTDTYLACVITAEVARIIGADLVRDHLLETLEMHLSTRLVDGYYPRLGLATGQRFASKGGFLVRFADAEGTRLVADGDWTVP